MCVYVLQVLIECFNEAIESVVIRNRRNKWNTVNLSEGRRDVTIINFAVKDWHEPFIVFDSIRQSLRSTLVNAQNLGS